MNRLQIAVLLPLVMIGFCLSVVAESDEFKNELRSVERMRATLKDKELWPFFDTAISESWSTPWIRSDYWVDRLPDKPEDKVQLERAKRALGLDLANALDAEALQVVKPVGSPIRERQAEQLLNAASWLRKSRGYGNLLLSTRAESLACVPIGYLVADLSYSTNKIDALISRLSTPDSDVNFRLSVIDEEAPMPLNIVRSKNVKEANAQLELAWNRGHHEMSMWCQENGVRRARDKNGRRELPEKYAFFADDDSSQPPYTTAKKWDQKQHQSFCVYGGNKGIRQQVDALYLFRQKVGQFPSQPPAWYGPDEKIYTVVQAAFTQAWEPYRKEYGPLGNLAAQVYELIESNRLMDWDTYQLADSLKQNP